MMPASSRILAIHCHNGPLKKEQMQQLLHPAQIVEVHGRQALARALERSAIDLAIVDTALGWDDGLEVLRTLKARHPRLPVVVATAQGDEVTAVAAMKAGADDYVSLGQEGTARLEEAVSLLRHRAGNPAGAPNSDRLELELLTTLQQVGALQTTSLGLEEVYERLFDLLAEVVDYDSGSILLLQDDGTLDMVASRGLDDVAAVERFVRELEFNVVHGWPDDGSYRVISDTRRCEEWNVNASMADIRSWIGALLTVKEEPIGLLNVVSKSPHAYDDVLGETVNAFANQAAVAIENARLYEETRQRANELEIVYQVAVSTATVVDIDRLIGETTAFIAERIYPDVFGFILLDEETGSFVPHASYHGLPQEGFETSVPLDSSITGRVVRTGEPLVVPDVREHPLYFSIVEETRSEIAVPLHAAGRVIGAINVESRERNAFSHADLRFLTTLARQVASAYERAQLYEDLEQHAAQLADEVRRRTSELQAERDRMLAILESAGEGILFTDCDGTILYVNPALERQTGYTRNECQGKSLHLWKDRKTAPHVFDDMWQTVLDGERWHGEVVNRRKDGSRFDAAVTITPLYDQHGELTGSVGVQADISHLKEVDRLKSKFIANVSHELRTPLTNIRMYASLLERGEVNRWEHYLEVIQYETDRLTRLIQDLLDLSRLEAQPDSDQTRPVNVPELVREMMRAFGARAERKQIELVAELDHEVPPVLTDRSEFHQVLNNLVANALAYTPDGGHVCVMVDTKEVDGRGMLRLRVADDGPGITESDLPRLFDRFYRGEAAQRSNEPGTGLGLAICKEIVANNRGRIEVDSAVGDGSTFTVWWPLRPEYGN
ncbi:MAG TPA: GAF domain-containing protein [Candidatus Sulfomarinibacteraceae bacterium]|nr:GAF domain-containing protein [Candidatus Sulfomarinibacteraceae bacterium]